MSNQKKSSSDAPQSMSLNEKLDVLMKNQNKILENEKKILGEEEKIESIDEKELEGEEEVQQDEEKALKEMETLESDLKKNISKPLTKITKRDVMKGFVGAFVGVVSHFAFTKAADLAPMLGFWRSTVLYIFSFIMIIVLLYYTGFRYIEKRVVLRFMPLRAIILYVVSIITVLLVNLLFGKLYFPMPFTEIYSIVGASMVLAVMGAGTADLLGREN